MPARKKTTTKRKTATKKKAAPRKAAAAKVTAKKKTVAKKSPARKKPVTKKKVAAKKKPVARKSSAKKKASAAKKPVARKVASKKKAAAKKKPAAKKVVSRKRVTATKKPVAKKRVTKKAAATRKKAGAQNGGLHGFAPYKQKAREEYMSPAMLDHFDNILRSWKRELMEEVDRTVVHMKDEAANFPDPNDRATQESDFSLELRTRDRERKLLRKIDQALARVEEGSYGFCEETGDEIGLKRLEARPVATLSVEAQERRERQEMQYRDRDDR